MPIETANFISDFVVTNPLGSDERNTADDHLRLLKTVLKGQFPNFTAAAVVATVSELNVLGSMTSNTGELNKLTNLATTTAELTYLASAVKGVASANKAVVADAGNRIHLGEMTHVGTGMGGVAAAYTLTLTSVPVTTNRILYAIPNVTCADAATLDVNGAGSRNIVTAPNEDPIVAGELAAGISYMFMDNGATWLLLNPSDASAVVGVPNFLSTQVTYTYDHSTGPSELNVITHTVSTSVGPTGSGATVIWAGLDVLPANTKWIEFNCWLRADVIGGTLAQIAFAAAPFGVTAGGSQTRKLKTRIFLPDYVGDIETETYGFVRVALGANNRFNSIVEKNGTNFLAQLSFVGFGV